MFCFLNHTPGEHCGGCVSGGVHETASTCRPLVVNGTKGLVRQRFVEPLNKSTFIRSARLFVTVARFSKPMPVRWLNPTEPCI